MRIRQYDRGHWQQRGIHRKGLCPYQKLSEETAAIIDNEVKKVIDSCYDKAKQILTENIDKLNKLADILLEKEKIEGDEFDRIMAE